MGPFEVFTIFDWISPLVGTARCAAGMRPVSVYWDRNSPRHYQKVLRRQGIKAGQGPIVAGKGFIILVPQGDVGRARQILEEAGASLA